MYNDLVDFKHTDSSLIFYCKTGKGKSIKFGRYEGEEARKIFNRKEELPHVLESSARAPTSAKLG